MASRVDRVEDLCAQLIRLDTTNRGHGQCCGEREAAEFVADLLADAGQKPATLERAPRRTNVVAQVAGSDPGLEPLLVHAHLDVVPADAGE